MGLTTPALRHGIAVIRTHLEGQHAALSELDGQVGDGDLGITLIKAFRELDGIAPDLPEDLGQAFMMMASAVSKVSSSSFGTLLATSLMSAAKATRGETALDWATVPTLMDAACAAMSARGKAQLGDKTVLDALDAAAREATKASDPDAMAIAAVKGINAALDTFRDQPAKVGRARIFGDRTIGLDDPGMVALREMAHALTCSIAE
ncbi:dihydroxyacetone kinase subunit L [Roseicitreum antarcticum]|uniref:Dihydroxyacetone kinase, C-terminal domain n=1 Tax=Roseicitreum antarcticum TaxID=564137 RepID=A0A1H2YIU5_9RHOB|nr:dihydroxyacetone kinase subunit L [Roseicitreum antarcticum]SDX05096.1 dihydroxyacetone kinase, C-terminal domain [Roseicitreum antarcticum]